MLYKEFVNLFKKLESTKKGLEKTKLIAEFLPNIKTEPKLIYLLKGRVFPDYDKKELGISEQIIIKAISKISELSERKIQEEYRKLGDLGLVMERLDTREKQIGLFSQELTAEKVTESIKSLTDIVGSGAIDKKIKIIIELLGHAIKEESKYIIRTILGDLKIGIGNGLLRDAIVEFVFSPKTIEEKKEKSIILQEAYDKTIDFSEVFEKSIMGENELKNIQISPGKPLNVMLYPKAKDISDAFNIVGKPAAIEYKYDGFRMMINKDASGSIKIFTRRLDDVTSQFPDAVKYAMGNINAKTFIIDCEAVGFDGKTKKYRPFQEISQRIKRKYDIEKLEKELPIELNIFDIVYYSNKSLINTPFIERRKIIEKIIKQEKYKIVLSKQIITDSEEEVEKFYNEALEDEQEGVMIKNLNAIYRPGARIGYAVKLKPDPKELDLVITGAEWGSGKRTGWLTSFNVSCQDENNNLLEIGKVSTGLKEKDIEGLSFNKLTNILKPYITEETGKEVSIKPNIIVMVGYQNLQESKTYSSGFALRFPRMIRVRPDKSIIDIATVEEIKNDNK